MDTVHSSREIFQKAAIEAENAEKVECKPLRPNAYVENQKSLVALVRTEDRTSGIVEALCLIGGLTSNSARYVLRTFSLFLKMHQNERVFIWVKKNRCSATPILVFWFSYEFNTLSLSIFYKPHRRHPPP